MFRSAFRNALIARTLHQSQWWESIKIHITMRIKDSSGNEHSVTGQGQGNLNTVLGAVGTYGALQSGALSNILGAVGNRGGNGTCCDPCVTRYEIGLMQEIAAKDGKIALLESNIYTDQKIADVYERLNTKVERYRDEQAAINREQAVYNGVNTATVQCLQGQVQQILSLTRLVVPNASVCPGWGDVTITPATTTTTATGA